MVRQLDILALEPYFGGARRHMLETMVRCSRHRWTLLTLPPRRMERRLVAAAHWFGEQLTRKKFGPPDVLFTSDALNLADLHRLHPPVATQPSVVYFHCNQLPEPGRPWIDAAFDLTNLNSATSASQVWFNSHYHARSFVAGLKSLIDTHEELQSRSPLEEVSAKVRVMPPPIDLQLPADLRASSAITRDPGTVFLDTRDANLDLVNGALKQLHQLKHDMKLLIVGDTDGLYDGFAVTVIPENDHQGHVRGLMSAGVYLSAKIATCFDELAVYALSVNCRPVLPHSGVYAELLPEQLHDRCLYDMSTDALTQHLREALCLPTRYHASDLSARLKPFDAISACKIIDDRLDELAASEVVRQVTPKKSRLKKV